MPPATAVLRVATKTLLVVQPARIVRFVSLYCPMANFGVGLAHEVAAVGKFTGTAWLDVLAKLQERHVSIW